ncbi:MAG: glycosyltransferase family 4 protein [Lachnospiraceae bacterium]|nr:glycosyltransferase family 4 protein [Lachnospiraceae bacterium]
MRILITTEWYAPVVNGVVTSVLNLQRELECLGHEVKILTLSNTTESCTEGNVTYIGSLNAAVVYPQARVAVSLRSREIEKLMEWHPQIIHSQCEFSTFVIAVRIARELNIPIVHTYHTVYEDYTHYFSPVKKWGRAAVGTFTRKVLERTNCVIVPTEKVKKILLRYGVKEEIRVIPTGIDMSRYSRRISGEERQELRAKLGIPEKAGTAVFVGRLAREKNLEEIISMFSMMKQENFRLLIVGDGPYRHELEEYVKTCGIEEQVIFTGMVPPDDVYRYYQAGDVFVSASTSETQGLTYVEALANGLPALCRKDDCLDGVIEDGVNGWQYEDSVDFLEKLHTILAPENRQLRSRLSAGAEESVYKRYSAEQFAQNAVQVYESTIRAAGAVPAYMRAV